LRDHLVPVDYHGKVGLGKGALIEQGTPLAACGINPVERLRYAGQKVAQPVVLGVQAAAEDRHPRADRAHVR
jgi:hypothetical protein